MSSNETTPTVDIKDYLLDKSPGEYVQAKAGSPYQVLLQTASDFIISRKKGKVEQELVILVSENLFYFKEKEQVEEVTVGKLQTFLRDLRGFYITLEQVLWMPALNKDCICRLMGVISNPTYLDMARANVLTDNSYSSYDHWCARYWEQNPRLFEELHAATLFSGVSTSNYRDCVEVAYMIERKFGYDEALYFTEVLKKSNFTQFACAFNRYTYSYPERLDGLFQLLNEPYNLELRRLIDYTFIDTYAQGITKIGVEFWQVYEKYLSMQVALYGEVKDKYPRYLMTAHDVATLNIGLLERITSDDDFTELTAEVRSLAHDDNEYSIVVPTSARQIAEEGIALSHCIGTHAERIAAGDLHILFLRNSNAREQPLVTLQFSNERITGAEGLHRRTVTPAERKFLEKWGKEKDVQIAA